MAEEEDIFLEDINEYVEQAAKTACSFFRYSA